MGALTVRLAEPLARHTAWRTGGRCGAFVVAHDRAGLQTVLADCRSAGWRWTLLGAGTRTVVRDGGIEGVVLRLGPELGAIRHLGQARWEVGAAAPVPALVAAATRAGHSGVEPLTCVPGSVGASVVLDGLWDEVVEEVAWLHRGRERWGEPSEARARKRIVLAVRIRLVASDPSKVAQRVRSNLRRERPYAPSSWYGAPKRGSLRRVLATVQLPLVRLRQCAIPEVAPEVLVNLGHGSAADLALLHKSALHRVQQARGLALQSRVRWVGSQEAP